MTLTNENFVERQFCPCCLSSAFDVLYQCPFTSDPIRQYLKDVYDPQGGVDFSYLEGAGYVLRRCRSCFLLYQAEIGNDFLQRKLYEEWIDASLAREQDDQGRSLLDHVLYAREIITVLAALGKLPAETHVFDFGMGWGRWLRMAKGFGCHVYGTELSEARTNFAKSQGIQVISWSEIPSYNFDFINAEQVFEHIPDPLGTLRQLCRGLNAEGLVKISVPDGKAVLDLLRNPNWAAPRGSRRSLNAVAPLEHINCFGHETLVMLARAAELTPVELQTDTYVEVEDGRNGRHRIRTGFRRLKRAIKGFVPEFGRRRGGTYLFFARRDYMNG